MYRRIAVLHPPDEVPAVGDRPPHCRLIPFDPGLPSAVIRNFVFLQQNTTDMLTPAVSDYIRRHQLFRGGVPLRDCILTTAAPKLQLVFDPKNARSQALAPSPCRERLRNLRR